MLEALARPVYVPTRSVGTRKTYCGSDDLDAVAWYYVNSGRQTHPVGKKQKNDFGLYDLSGNVWEWVQDCWHDSYNDAPSDGSTWENNCADGRRVVRGGSGSYDVWDARSAGRFRYFPVFRFYNQGFRLAQD